MLHDGDGRFEDKGNNFAKWGVSALDFGRNLVPPAWRGRPRYTTPIRVLLSVRSPPPQETWGLKPWIWTNIVPPDLTMPLPDN